MNVVLWILILAAAMGKECVNANGVPPDLLPFGPAQGDGNLQDNVDSVHALKDVVSPTFSPPYRFPACGSLQQNIYFTDNGLIVMYNGKKEKYAYPRPTNGSTFDATLNNRVFIAPFFSDVNFSSDSNVYYQVYKRMQADPMQSAVLNKTDELINVLQVSNFSVEWMLVITWYRVFSSSSSNNLTNTFQAIVATNGRQGYTIFQYQVGHMLWDFDMLPFPDVVIGYKCPNGATTYINDPDPQDLIDIHKRPDMYLGNTNQLGIWVYRLDSNPDTYVNPEQECDQWQAAQPDPSSWMLNVDCPCSHNQAMFDSAYELLNLTDLGIDETVPFSWPSLPTDCYYRTFLASDSPGVLCCYDSLEALIQFPNDVFFGAVSERYLFNPFFSSGSGALQDQYNTWIEREILPRYHCCVASYSQSFCESYENKRPKTTCGTYMPPTLAWCVGDPHYTTFDKTQYTFNGNGEFQLTYIRDPGKIFNLQARSEYLPRIVTNATATVFTYFVMVHQQAPDSVGFDMDATGTSFTVRINEYAIITADQVKQGHMLGMCFIKKKKDSQHIVFSCKDGIAVTVCIEHGFGNLLLSVPDIYKMKANQGFFGTFDGDSQNDLPSRSQYFMQANAPYGTGPNGTLTTTELLSFGYSWKLSVPSSFYYAVGNNFNLVNQTPITPTHLNELESTADSSLLNKTKIRCQNDDICIYDTLATQNPALGLTTKQINDGNLQMQEQLDKFPPSLNMSYLEVYVGKAFTRQLFAEDRNNDDVTFSLLSVLPNSSITSGGLFTWTPSSSEKVNITFVANDGSLQSSVTPIVKLCNCVNETQCNYNQSQQDSQLWVDKFAIASCDCPVGKSGATCEEDFNPCVVEPCFPNVLCNDLPAPSLGFTCQTCPIGLMGDGGICQDLSEPVVVCPSARTVNVMPNANFSHVVWTPEFALANDSFDGQVIATCFVSDEGVQNTMTSNDTFNVGATLVYCTAADTAGNVGRCTFNVTVQDNEAPTVTCPIEVSMNVDPETAVSSVTWSPALSASDTVDGDITANVVCEDDMGKVVMSGGMYAVGLTTVRCRVNDTALNEGSCQFNITIVDNVSPVIKCPFAQVYTDFEPQTEDMSPLAIDAVDGVIDPSNITCVNDEGMMVMSGSKFNVGTTIVTCTAMDSSKNNGTCTFEIGVVETSKIVITGRILEINGDVIVYSNKLEDPDSTEALRIGSVINKVVNQILLRSITAAKNLIRISVVDFKNGSVIVNVLLEYSPGSTVTRSEVQQVLEDDIIPDNQLSDGVDVILIQPKSLVVDENDTLDSCPVRYCFNGGTCKRQGIFPDVVYSCSCPAEYTGVYCDIKIKGGGGGGELSTGVIIIIVIISIIVLLMVLMLCTCLIMRYQYEKRLAMLRYSYERDEVELNSLKHKTASSPYLQQRQREQSTQEQSHRMAEVRSGMEVPWYEKSTLAGWL